MQRTLVVGDVHGCHIALQTLLDRFDLRRDDHLILLGDVVDRGPDSRAVIQMLIELGSFCRLDLVLGNHEEMLLAAAENPAVAPAWLGWGGIETIASYGHSLSDIPDEHLDFLAEGRPYVETESHLCVHANLEPGVPLPEQSVAWLRWHKISGYETPHESGKPIVCGHTVMPGDVPQVRDGWIMLDTGAYTGSFLSAVELASGEILQARQDGSFRRGVFVDELR